MIQCIIGKSSVAHQATKALHLLFMKKYGKETEIAGMKRIVRDFRKYQECDWIVVKYLDSRLGMWLKYHVWRSLLIMLKVSSKINNKSLTF